MNLENLNVVELNAHEMQNTAGGGIVEILRGAAYVAQLVAAGVEALNEKCKNTPGCGCNGGAKVGTQGVQDYVNGSGGNKW